MYIHVDTPDMHVHVRYLHKFVTVFGWTIPISDIQTDTDIKCCWIVEESLGILFLNHLLDGPANEAHILTTN